MYVLCTLCTSSVFGQWKPAGDRIMTPWAVQIDTSNVLSEYPRPIMERKNWQNLNGLWQYKLVKRNQPGTVVSAGKILVPFAIESALSGVGCRVGTDEEIVYSRYFDVNLKTRRQRVLLHFGAVDWQTDVWVNGIKVGNHSGGYTPFSFDITEALNKKGHNELVVRVWDPTDAGYQPRGKQVNKPEGIWYTPVSGIWQTVWLETVNEVYFDRLKIASDIDRGLLYVDASVQNRKDADVVEVVVYDRDVIVASAKSINGQRAEIQMPGNFRLWSPDFPFLYDLKVRLWRHGELMDEVDSYAAMRKISTMRDESGVVRLALNNKPLFQFGPLDQGWWPDGLYTAPTDEALQYDIKMTKDMGFNMIRKHIKVEPARWYTYCDRMGILVWQDMPSGDRNPQWQNRRYFNGEEMVRSAESEACYRKEWKEIIDALYSYPCICTWVPFNEAWGQFKTPEIVEWTKNYDPTRLVNPASGGNHYRCGDMLDLHNYPGPELYLYDSERATVLGEYGGIGLALKEHLWEPNRNWGYIQFGSSKEVTDQYEKYIKDLKRLIPKGFSAAVYTQTTDVEMEVNGLMTYDRKVMKMDVERIKALNKDVCHSLDKTR